ncbi:helix-turn-helix transcriptional regulator [Streptomyces sp. SID3343]|uniref:helix-turn-helix domain-containing protein n=1 Tax=Streptomyces sp. SID3343 TaxID=2690260 RepID=UPI00137187F4|nr:helix-turn-helix transcriptional regulator [Streptomyces sp. SID3343]MYW00888.1 helix-turn-helix domain-containing protein [Streptomyces sp. SID3343]
MNKGQLGAALRALWKASGKEAQAVARSALMSPSKLSKIENARLTPSMTDVERILTALGVSAEARAEYTAAAREAATEIVAWRLLKRAGVHRGQQAAKALESQMSILRLFQPALIPGLLQTPEYMRAILQRHDLGEDILNRTIAGRIERQLVLHDAKKSLNFIVTESVLRWRILPPGMMAGQIDRIISISRLPHVDIRVVLLRSRQNDVPSHSFVIRDDRLVTIEAAHARIDVTDARDIDLYAQKFDAFARIAVSGDDMRDILAEVRNEFLREQEIDL